MSQDKDTILSTMEELKQNLELFYQQKNQEALEQFDSILGKLASTVDMLFAYRESHADFSFDEEKVKSSLVEAMEAMQDKDLILVADIMQYDFIEYIEEILPEME